MDEEARLGGVPDLVLSYSLWQSKFNGDPSIVGKVVEINRHPLTVIGVAPKGFIGCMPGLHSDAWIPLAANTDAGSNDWIILHRENPWLNVMGRLRPGISRERATRDIDTLMRQIVATYPNEHAGANTITLDPLWRSPFGANVYLAASLPILLAIAFVVLLLACANVATLALVRFVSRRREIAIRRAMGANDVEILRQMLLEGFIVSLAGGALAILFTRWTARIIGSIIPPNANPIVLNGAVDGSVLFAVLGLSVMATLICGALPAWRSSRVAPVEVLKEESGGVAGSSPSLRLLSGLLVTQVALSLALLVCAGLFLRTLRNSSGADPGFEQSRVLTAAVGLATAGYTDQEAAIIQRKLLTRMREIPEATEVSLTDWLPFNYNRKTVEAYPEGYVPRLHESGEVRKADVSSRYFATMGIPLISGRDFTDDDNEKAPRVAIVDQTAANHYWPGQDAIGRRLRIWGHWVTVVGVARNSSHQRVGELLEPMVYQPFFQDNDIETILQVRTAGDPQSLVPGLEQAIQEVDPHLPFFDVRPLHEVTQLSGVFARMEASFATVFAVIALILAATGIYGVVGYRTALRTHEIGIRLALGAARGDVLRMVVYQGMQLAGLGIVIGLILSVGLTRFLAAVLYGVSTSDPLTMVAVVLLLASVAAAACYLPARRATRVDPVTAIRVM